MAYTIYATVSVKGKKQLSIETNIPRHTAQNWGERAVKAGVIRDYQTAVANTMDEARSLIMSNFGIGFYNAGRKRIDELLDIEFRKAGA